MKSNKQNWDLCPKLTDGCYNKEILKVIGLKIDTLVEKKWSKSDNPNRRIRIKNKRRRPRVRVSLLRTLLSAEIVIK